MDRACSATALQLLPYYCNKAPNTTFAKHAKKQDIVMTTKDLQELLTPSSPVNDEMINLYLELLCTQYNLTYLCTDVIPALCREGWPSVRRYFSNYRNRVRTHTRPRLVGEPVIIIPCFVHGGHWVIVVRREIEGKVQFLFVNDLNSTRTESAIKSLLSARNTSPEFHPENSQWVTCKNFTYQPHSNECGPRTIVAATILALHQTPSSDILLPMMHPNLAQIARTWVAVSLLNNKINSEAINEIIASNYQPPFQSTVARSEPANLIQWVAAPSSQQVASKPSKTRSLDPKARPFNPKSSVRTVGTNDHCVAPQSLRKPRPHTTRQPFQAPTKWKSFILPGQQMINQFFTARPPPKRSTDVPPPGVSAQHVSIQPDASQSSQPAKEQSSQIMILPKAAPVVTQPTLYDFSFVKPQASVTETDPDT